MSITKAQIDQYIEAIPWRSQPGPQTDAFWSEADMVLYGGSAGGGKTALAVGLAVTMHRETLFVRKQAKQLGAVVDYMAETIGTRDGWNSQEGIFRLPKWDGVTRQVVIGSVQHPGDETKYQGRPRDLLVIDECANLTEGPVAFLRGWVRSTVEGQRCRTLLCSNPPTDANGYWLIEWFAPWLDPTHEMYPHPPGELIWYAALDGKEQIVSSSEPFDHNGEKVIPQSRTFIPASIMDNKYLKDTGYVATLQALPEPLRSQMLYGDFTAGQEDGEWQVIPSEWVQAAMDRWEPRTFNPTKIVSAGLDPSRGGKDSTVLACREDWYYHELQDWEGHEVPDGQTAAAKVIELLGISHCPVHIDVIGIGASVVDILGMYIHSRVVPVNVAEGAKEDTDWSGTLKFGNKRAQLWWQFRDILNPDNGFNVALPNNQRLKAELCSPTYQLKANGIMVESKKELIKRLGRSTDKADAVLMAAERTAILNMTGMQGLSGRIQVNN